MKKLLVTILLLTGGFLTSQAQEISFGVKGGINFASLTNTGTYNVSSIKDWTAGIVVEFEISDRFSIQPEVLYSAQGGDVNFVRPNPEYMSLIDYFDAKVNLDYINVPILAKFYVVDGLSIDIGPQFAFLVDNNIEFTKTVPTNPQPTVTYHKTTLPQKKSFGIDGSVGLGYKFPERIFIQGRYNFGLIDIEDIEKSKNSVFQLTIGYEFW
ncbi:porin family protein [Aureivirga sp. CE67]|uniref:porin family protein n=1 Tax=Aureivirga sp. CE67 TaxID=1788983 RepID=UPI0018CBDFDA|nr:porin family protein [Aureivirga sp. CE67]